jgi:clan AA aspartic protease
MIVISNSEKYIRSKKTVRNFEKKPTKDSLENLKNTMGLIRTNIELISTDDLALCRRGHIKEPEIKRLTVEALVDTGADLLVINEEIAELLGLAETGEETVELGDGTIRKLKIVGPIMIIFKNRHTIVEAAVAPGNAEVLLGAIPLEGLDVIIDPKKMELTLPPDRPDRALRILKGGMKRVPKPLQ